MTESDRKVLIEDLLFWQLYGDVVRLLGAKAAKIPGHLVMTAIRDAVGTRTITDCAEAPLRKRVVRTVEERYMAELL